MSTSPDGILLYRRKSFTVARLSWERGERKGKGVMAFSRVTR